MIKKIIELKTMDVLLIHEKNTFMLVV